MARLASTYRGARARAQGKNFRPLTTEKRGNRITVVFMGPPKVQPVQPKGWDWRLGGRREREAAASPGFAAIAKEMGGNVKQALLRIMVGAQ